MAIIIGNKTYTFANTLGSLIVLLVLIACFVLWLMGHALTSPLALLLIAGLAIGILLL